MNAVLNNVRRSPNGHNVTRLPAGRFNPPGRARAKRSVQLGEFTAPLDCLHGKRVLVVDDTENTYQSAQDAGFVPSYRALAERIRAVAASCDLHAVFSRRPGDNRLVENLEEAGWTPHPEDVQIIPSFQGRRIDANSDHRVAGIAGYLLKDADFNMLLICTGDGKLGNDIARFASGLKERPQVATLSLPAATNWRYLKSSTNGNIVANILMGQDCLIPFGQRKEETKHAEFQNDSGLTGPAVCSVASGCDSGLHTGRGMGRRPSGRPGRSHRPLVWSPRVYSSIGRLGHADFPPSHEPDFFPPTRKRFGCSVAEDRF